MQGLQTKLFNFKPPTRPNSFSSIVLEKTVDQLLIQIKGWLLSRKIILSNIDTNGPYLSLIKNDILESLSIEICSDSIISNLQFYNYCNIDGELISIIETFPKILYSVYSEELLRWILNFGVQSKYDIGDTFFASVDDFLPKMECKVIMISEITAEYYISYELPILGIRYKYINFEEVDYD